MSHLIRSTPLLRACAALAVCAAAPLQAQTMPTVAPTPAVSAEVRTTFERLGAAPVVQRALEAVRADHDRSIEELKALTEIEAPPFREQQRAEAFLARMKAAGLAEASIDAEGNVVGIRKGTGGGPKLVVSAHLDTVFPLGTDIKVKERDGRLYAPGISDDTRGLAVLLSWLRALEAAKLRTVGDLVVVGNVGEEELGNLRGMKALFREHADIDGMVGLEPVEVGGIVVLGTGSRRYEFKFKGPGGHSYGAFGQVPSAIHGMGRAIAKIAEVQTPKDPKTTYTVGLVKGGTSVNTIAPDASMAVDIRSDNDAALQATEREILAAVDAAVVEENRRWNVTTLAVERTLIGDRPGGRTAADSVIVQAAVQAVAAQGRSAKLVGASTDANVPMSLGIPAVILSGGGKTGGFHALGEWFDPTDAWQGAQMSLATVLALAGVDGVSEPLLPKRPR